MALVDKQLISVDWDIRTLRVVVFSVRPKGGLRIRKVLSVDIPADVSVGDPESFGQLLREVLGREGISAKRMVVDVPRDQAVLKTLKLPDVSQDDLPAMVEFQIAKELPFPLREAMTDFAEPEVAGESGTLEVLVAAVRREVLDYYKQVAVSAGLHLERIGFRPFANKVAVGELLGDTRYERVLFVDVGPVFTEIDVLRDGKMAFSRAASVMVPKPSIVEPPPLARQEGATLDLDLGITVDSGGPVIPEQEHVVQALLREVVLTIEAYRAGDPGSDMNHVVVSGDTGVEDELLDGLRRRFDINGERYNPTSCFGWNSVSGAAAGGFAAALGLALGHGGHGNLYVDFLHPKKTVSQHQKSLKKAPIVAAILLLFIGAGVVAYRQVVLPQKEQIVGLDDQIAKARTKLKEYKKFGAMMEQVESFEHEQVVWLDDLADFLLVWPDHDQIVLSEISLSQKERLIEVKMDCKDTKIAADTVDKLDGFKLSEDAPARFDAKLGTTTDQKDKDEYTVRTRMDIKLINRGKSD